MLSRLFYKAFWQNANLPLPFSSPHFFLAWTGRTLTIEKNKKIFCKGLTTIRSIGIVFNMLEQNTHSPSEALFFQKTGVPLYLQVAAFLRRKIESGEWSVGYRLPSLEELAHHFSLSRVTVRQAVQSLVAEHLLESLQGKGTFVASNPDPHQRVRLLTSWSSLLKRVEKFQVELLDEDDVTSIPPLKNRPLKFYPQYHHMRRVHRNNDVPFAFLHVYLASEIFEQAPDTMRTIPVLAALGEVKIEVSKANQILTIGAAEAEASHFLSIPQSSPVAYVLRVAEDKFGKVFYAASITYPGAQIYQEIDMLM